MSPIMYVDIFPLILALFSGIGLGLFYFGGLWLTVKRFPNVQRRISLVIGSFVIRNAVSAVLLWLMARGGHWERVIICLLGFIIARTFLVRRLRPQKALSIHEER